MTCMSQLLHTTIYNLYKPYQKIPIIYF